MKRLLHGPLFWIFVAMLAGCLPGMTMKPPIIIRQFPLVRVSDTREALVSAYQATVLIMVESGPNEERIDTCGSGVLIGPHSILTAAHVVAHEHPLIGLQFSDGKRVMGHIERIAAEPDLAIITFDGHVETHPLTLAKQAPPLMSTVWNFGAPECQAGYMSQGLWGDIDGKARVVSGGFLWPGMSGGPVVNERGEIIGVNDAVWTNHEGDLIAGMGYAVDWKDVHAFLSADH